MAGALNGFISHAATGFVGGACLDVVTAYFNVGGYSLLADSLDQVTGVRLLLGLSRLRRRAAGRRYGQNRPIRTGRSVPGYARLWRAMSRTSWLSGTISASRFGWMPPLVGWSPRWAGIYVLDEEGQGSCGCWRTAGFGEGCWGGDGGGLEGSGWG